MCVGGCGLYTGAVIDSYFQAVGSGVLPFPRAHAPWADDMLHGRLRADARQQHHRRGRSHRRRLALGDLPWTCRTRAQSLISMVRWSASSELRSVVFQSMWAGPLRQHARVVRRPKATAGPAASGMRVCTSAPQITRWIHWSDAFS